MKILIPILSFDKSGGYRVLSMLASYMQQLDYYVTFLVNENSDVPYFPTNAKIIWITYKGTFTKINLEKSKRKTGGKYVFYNLHSLYKGIKKVIHEYDAVIANQSLTTWPIFFSVPRAKRIYYIQAYEPEFYKSRKGINKKLLWCLSYLSYLLPFSRITNSPIYFKYKNIKANEYVPPGIDFKIFYSKKNRIINGKPLILGCIGRKEPIKGTKLVLDAFKIMIQKEYNVMLKVAYGNIPIDNSIKNIEIVIPRNDQELAEFYRSIDVLIAPAMAQKASYHYPVMEAMAVNTITITPGHSPSNKSNAYIIRSRNITDIVEAVNDIINNPMEAENKSQKAYNDIKEFSWEGVTKKFCKIIEQNIHPMDKKNNT